MNKEKRNIQPHADKEVKHLMVLLDKSQAGEFKRDGSRASGQLGQETNV